MEQKEDKAQCCTGTLVIIVNGFWSVHLSAKLVMYPRLVDSRAPATPVGKALINPRLLL